MAIFSRLDLKFFRSQLKNTVGFQPLPTHADQKVFKHGALCGCSYILRSNRGASRSVPQSWFCVPSACGGGHHVTVWESAFEATIVLSDVQVLISSGLCSCMLCLWSQLPVDTCLRRRVSNLFCSGRVLKHQSLGRLVLCDNMRRLHIYGMFWHFVAQSTCKAFPESCVPIRAWSLLDTGFIHIPGRSAIDARLVPARSTVDGHHALSLFFVDFQWPRTLEKHDQFSFVICLRFSNMRIF